MNERIKELLKLELNQVFFFKNKEYHFYNDILLENFKLGVQIATSILSNNNGWISIDDKLPPQTGDYLVYDTFLGITITRFYPSLIFGNKEMEKWSFGNLANVTHWQYLPNEPKG